MMNKEITVKCVKSFGLFYYKAYWRGVEISSAMSEVYAYHQAYKILYRNNLIKTGA
jgi:hypothetical protein